MPKPSIYLHQRRLTIRERADRPCSAPPNKMPGDETRGSDWNVQNTHPNKSPHHESRKSISHFLRWQGAIGGLPAGA